MAIKAEDISKIIRDQIGNYAVDVDVAEPDEVLEPTDAAVPTPAAGPAPIPPMKLAPLADVTTDRDVIDYRPTLF